MVKREFLRLISGVFGWDDDKIVQIVQETAEEAVAVLSLLPGEERDYSRMPF